jgi:pyrroloquinoline-quinone synthase
VDFWERLEESRAGFDVLRHPFYVRWSAGQLTSSELALYAGQYRHAVVALADATANAARAATPDLAPALWEHADEEAAHVSLWDGFGDAVGADRAAVPLPETAACARTWSGAGRPMLETLVALYAIESAQPAIAETKRVGLRAHYGIDDTAATAYFDVHVERDLAHASAGRALIEQRLGAGDEDQLLASAEAVWAANWKLLDGVQMAGLGSRSMATD